MQVLVILSAWPS